MINPYLIIHMFGAEINKAPEYFFRLMGLAKFLPCQGLV